MYASTEQLSLRSKQPTWVLQLAQVQLVPLAEIDAVGDVKDKDAVQKFPVFSCLLLKCMVQEVHEPGR